MAWMRGTYYVYENINGGIDMHVGSVMRPGNEYGIKPDPKWLIKEYDREATQGHIRIPKRIMHEFAAEAVGRMTDKEYKNFCTNVEARRKQKGLA